MFILRLVNRYEHAKPAICRGMN